MPDTALPRPVTKIHVRQCHHLNQRIRFYTCQTTLGFGLPALDCTLQLYTNLHPPPHCTAWPPTHPGRAESRWLSHAIQGWYWSPGHSATVRQPPTGALLFGYPSSLPASHCILTHDVHARWKLAPCCRRGHSSRGRCPAVGVA